MKADNRTRKELVRPIGHIKYCMCKDCTAFFDKFYDDTR
jgi:hypothetical protein